MLIPTAFAKLPAQESCHNNQIVFGGTVGQMANALAQLTNCKFLGEAHYHVGQQVLPAIGGMINFGYGISGSITTSNTYNILYQSTALSSHLAVIVQYRASNFEFGNVYLRLRLRDTGFNAYTGTVLDYGVNFLEETDLDNTRDTLSTAFTGTTLIDAPTNTTYDPPRPLYVPSANRGQLLNISVQANLLLPATIHVYDILVPEVTV